MKSRVVAVLSIDARNQTFNPRNLDSEGFFMPAEIAQLYCCRSVSITGLRNTDRST
jgi:hypothetical protein